MEKLNIKTFDTANSEWADFVTKGRANALTHNYDGVSGPMLANQSAVREGASPRLIGQQLAAFTNKSAKLVNKY